MARGKYLVVDKEKRAIFAVVIKPILVWEYKKNITDKEKIRLGMEEGLKELKMSKEKFFSIFGGSKATHDLIFEAIDRDWVNRRKTMIKWYHEKDHIDIPEGYSVWKYTRNNKENITDKKRNIDNDK